MFKLHLVILYNGKVIEKCIFINSLHITTKQIKHLISTRIFICNDYNFVDNIEILHMNNFLDDKTLLKDIYNNDICYLTIILYNSKL